MSMASFDGWEAQLYGPIIVINYLRGMKIMRLLKKIKCWKAVILYKKL